MVSNRPPQQDNKMKCEGKMNIKMFNIEFTEKCFDTDISVFANKFDLRDKPFVWDEVLKCHTRKRFRGAVVYLMFMDAYLDGEELIPLYVGKTCNIVTRLNQHREKAWFNHVEYMFVERFDAVQDAEDLERELIKKLRPVFNKQIRGKKTQAQLHTPKTASMKNLRDLVNHTNFNGDKHYDWVTKELPTIQSFQLR